ncbi:MAG: Holliday junction branch migration DNA helicase RuvB, partial [Arthrobacter sp.]
APAWTHLGYAIPSNVFAQEQLDLFEPGGDASAAGEWAPEGQ